MYMNQTISNRCTLSLKVASDMTKYGYKIAHCAPLDLVQQVLLLHVQNWESIQMDVVHGYTTGMQTNRLFCDAIFYKSTVIIRCSTK